jgi:hypothetical protein
LVGLHMPKNLVCQEMKMMMMNSAHLQMSLNL